MVIVTPVVGSRSAAVSASCLTMCGISVSVVPLTVCDWQGVVVTRELPTAA